MIKLGDKIPSYFGVKIDELNLIQVPRTSLCNINIDDLYIRMLIHVLLF